MEIVQVNESNIEDQFVLAQMQRERQQRLDPRLPEIHRALDDEKRNTIGIANGTSISYLAYHNREPIAYVMGIEQNCKEDSVFASMVHRLRQAAICFGMLDTPRAKSAIRELYGKVAHEMVDKRGIHVHTAYVPSEDKVAIQALFHIQFGLHMIRGTLDLSKYSFRSDTIDSNLIQIRHATPSDQSLFEELYIEATKSYARHPVSKRDSKDLASVLYATFEEDLISNNFVGLVAEMDGKPVGIADGYIVQELDSWNSTLSTSPLALFNGMIVRSSAQGQGIGRALTNALFSLIHKKCPSAEYLHAYYFAGHPQGGVIWEKEGFKPLLHSMIRCFPPEDYK